MTVNRSLLARLLADYGIVLALLALCIYFSLATVSEQQPAGAPGGSQLAREIIRAYPEGKGTVALIVVRDSREDAEFASALRAEIENKGIRVAAVVAGQPSNARAELQRFSKSSSRLDVIACGQATATWTVFDNLAQRYPQLADVRIMSPKPYRGSNFLKPDNLLNIANQIAVIAILAIGMTMVIVTGGIDLSVGSLIALSAVTATVLLRDMAGAERAGTAAMLGCSVAGIAICGGVGLFSGLMITLFRIPAFIVTLAVMLVANGLAFILAKGQSAYQIPDSYVWLGRGAVLGLPVAALLMAALYVVAHIFMSRTQMGRHIYAVGSNPEAARLAGVPVNKVLRLVYLVSGLTAGLGGIVMASQLKSGSPTYGVMYELYVIAAVVVGGTSLSGGQGKVFGTLIGVLIIAVIQNGMNLTGVESYTQKVVLGLVILGAVLVDRLKQSAWNSG